LSASSNNTSHEVHLFRQLLVFSASMRLLMLKPMLFTHFSPAKACCLMHEEGVVLACYNCVDEIVIFAGICWFWWWTSFSGLKEHLVSIKPTRCAEILVAK
jgi:hypothetical protein